MACEPRVCTGVCVSRCETVDLKPCHYVGIGSIGDVAVCVHSCVCMCNVHGGGKALSASPSLQHSLSFTPGRLLRNVSGREAKNIPLLLLLTAWADGAVGPQQAPWALVGGGTAGCGAECGVKRRRPSSAHSLPLFFRAPKPGPRLTSIRKPSSSHQELPHASVRMCVCLRCAVLPGREIWPPPAWGSSGQCLFCQSRDSGGQSLREGAPGDGLYLSSQSGDSQKKSRCYFLPETEGQGYSPGCTGSSGTSPGATRAL